MQEDSGRTVGETGGLQPRRQGNDAPSLDTFDVDVDGLRDKDIQIRNGPMSGRCSVEFSLGWKGSVRWSFGR